MFVHEITRVLGKILFNINSESVSDFTHILFHMDNTRLIMKKLVIIFPGAGYGLDCPLLYYADFLFETKGYERRHMKYQDILSRIDIPLEDKIRQLRDYTWKQVKDIDFGQYQEVVFLSKSIGAIEAGVITARLDVTVKQIFLTPVEESVLYLKNNSMVVIGTKDKAYSLYRNLCEEKDVKALYIEDADHSLEISNEPYASIQVLNRVMHFIEMGI